MFRIQNDDVIEKSKAKAKGKAAKGKAKASPAVQPAKSEEEEIDNTALEDAVILFSRQHLDVPGHWVTDISPFNLSPTIEQRARGWFQTYSHHWFQDSDTLDSLVSKTQGDEHLMASMYAVGLASFSNHVHSPELTSRARRGYVTALRLTNAALRSPIEARKDSTLFAIMILGIYETVAGTNAQSVLAWTSHVNGSAALVEFRGIEQFNSEAGQRLFYQVVSNLMITCIQQRIAMPQRIIDLRNEAATFIVTPRPIWIVTGAIIDFCSFRSEVREGTLAGPRETVKKALEIDQRFVEAFSNLPPDWEYESIFTDENPHLVWNKVYHHFQNDWVPPMWNGMRTCRIMLQETIRDQLLCSASSPNPVFTPAEADAQESRSVSICIDMGRDVMRSVQQHRTGDPTRPRSVLAGSHHAYIVWPLYLVGGMDVSTERVKEWVVNRLRIMSDEEGIKQAGVVAGHLAMREEFWDYKSNMSPWKGPPIARQWEGESRITDVENDADADADAYDDE